MQEFLNDNTFAMLGGRAFQQTPTYGVYISLLVRYSRDYGSYQDFLDAANKKTTEPTK